MQYINAQYYKNKTALITGASSGIGAATALAFAEAGANVVLADVNDADVVLQAIQAINGKAIYINADVRQSEQVQQLIESSVKEYGQLDYAFNNAGIIGAAYEAIDQFEESVWDDVIDVNLKGVWLCMKYQIKHMLSQGSGSIVNMSSTAGLVGSHLGSAYIASKHGVVGLTKAAAVEYAKANIRVNAICPGMTDTKAIEDVFKGKVARVKAAHPLGRLGTPEEIASSVLWLCSDDASFITGHTLTVDGGYVAQ